MKNKLKLFLFSLTIACFCIFKPISSFSQPTAASKIIPKSKKLTSAQTKQYKYLKVADSTTSKGFVSKFTPIDTLKKAMQVVGFEEQGSTTLVSGTKTISTTKVKANSKILVFLLTPSGTLWYNYSAPPTNITAGTSFVINAYQSMPLSKPEITQQFITS